MRKKISIIFAVLMLTLTGCGTYVESVSNDKQPSMFIVVEGDQTSLWRVVYHKETKVMYTVSGGAYNCGTFTLLVNSDGTPMLWEE